jgi:chemotaxis protein MotB
MTRRGFRPVTPALVVSGVLHSAVLGSAFVAWSPGEPSHPAARVVLVELTSPADAPAGAAGLPAGEPADDRRPDAGELARRVEELADANSELQARLEDERQRTAQLEARHRQAIAALETARQHLGEDLAALAADRSALAAEAEAERQRRAAVESRLAARVQAEEAARDELAATYDRLVSALGPELATHEVTIERANGSLTVAIVDLVLFPSGQATLTATGQTVIDRVGAALRQVNRRPILIEGHTDSVPIGRGLADRYPSNWELSAARATEVVKRMIDHADLAADRLRAVGRADTEPVAGNATEDGRRLNRRIEIILLPPPAARDAS